MKRKKIIMNAFLNPLERKEKKREANVFCGLLT